MSENWPQFDGETSIYFSSFLLNLKEIEIGSKFNLWESKLKLTLASKTLLWNSLIECILKIINNFFGLKQTLPSNENLSTEKSMFNICFQLKTGKHRQSFGKNRTFA